MDQRVLRSATGAGTDVPLVVDLDGTLIATDSLHEGVLAAVVSRPLCLFALPGWLRQGKAAFKDRIAAECALDASSLPVRPEVLTLLAAEHAAGRRIVLATAANRRWAEAVAARVGLIDTVIASDGVTNLAGPAKAEALVRAYGAKGFDYVGDSAADLPAWAASREAIAVGPSERVRSALARLRPDATVIEVPRPSLKIVGRALRLHQWAKNLLVFLPALAAHRTGVADLAVLLAVFVAFGLAASAIYLVNDLVDLASDRDHSRKRLRPFASGALPIRQGAALVPLLLFGGLSLAIVAGPAVAAVLAAYVALTFAYSLWLKRQPIVDVMTLAGLYTVRVVAGAAALSVVLSPWMIAFTVFLFLSLALIKRLTEIRSRIAEGRGDPAGRGYRLEDAPVVLMLAAAAGYASVVVLALYIDSAAMHRIWDHAAGLWVAAGLLLFWISRMILIAQRGEMHDDPIVFAARDSVSRATAGLILIAVTGSL